LICCILTLSFLSILNNQNVISSACHLVWTYVTYSRVHTWRVWQNEWQRAESIFRDAEMIKVHFTPIKTRAIILLVASFSLWLDDIINNDDRCQLESPSAVAINYIQIALKCVYVCVNLCNQQCCVRDTKPVYASLLQNKDPVCSESIFIMRRLCGEWYTYLWKKSRRMAHGFDVRRAAQTHDIQVFSFVYKRVYCNRLLEDKVWCE